MPGCWAAMRSARRHSFRLSSIHWRCSSVMSAGSVNTTRSYRSAARLATCGSPCFSAASARDIGGPERILVGSRAVVSPIYHDVCLDSCSGCVRRPRATRSQSRSGPSDPVFSPCHPAANLDGAGRIAGSTLNLMHQPSTTAVSEGAVRYRRWQMAVAEFGRALGCPPPLPEGHEPGRVEIGVIGLSGVGKSSLLNALIAPTQELLPSGGVGPLTGLPVHIFHAPAPTLRVKYLGRAWLMDALAKLDGAPSMLTSEEIGQLSLICTGNQYAARKPGWLAQAIRYALRPNTTQPPDGEPRTRDALQSFHELLQCMGTVREWVSDCTDGLFFRRVHEHVSGARAALCEHIELGWPSALLETGAVLLDLPGLGVVSDAYARQTSEWLQRARAIVVVVDRAGMAESIVTCLRRSRFLSRVVAGEADVIGVVTKLDQVTDDLRRRDGAPQSWARCFHAVAMQAETELSSQIDGVLRYEQDALTAITPDVAPRGGVRVFGVSSREHRRVVQYDPEDRPRLHIPESSGIPAVRRALVGLSRLRSNAWTSEILDRVRRSPDAATLLPELFSLVDTEGL